MISGIISSATAAVKVTGGGSVTDVYSDKTDDNYGIGEGLTFHADAEDNIALGENALNSTSGAALANIGIGTNALTEVTDSDYNIGIGFEAGKFVTTGFKNIFIGSYAGLGVTGAKTTGYYNLGVGHNALKAVQGAGNSNHALGYQALTAITTGADNVAIGVNAGSVMTTNTNCVLVGNYAGDAINSTHAIGTVAVGYAAGGGITSGIGNTAVGMQALLTDDDGDFSTAIGFKALTAQTGTTGTVGNTAVGYQAGLSITTATGTTAIGHDALGLCTTAEDNTVVGYNAAKNLAGSDNSGTSNTVIGAYAFDAAQTNERQNVVIGKSAGGAINEAPSDDNVLIGYLAGLGGVGTTEDCVVIGAYAMDGTGTNDQSGTVAIGYSALSTLTTGVGNLAIGYQAMTTHTTGSRNMAIGYGAMDDTDHHADTLASVDNVFIGYNSGGGAWETNNCDYNIAIGNYTLDAVMNGAEGNIAIGHSALTNVTTGDNNCGIGKTALYANTVGNNNTAIGYQTMYTNVDGSSNTAVGARALWTFEANTTHDGKNTALGNDAGYAVSTGQENTLIGYDAGDTIATGSENTIIGSNCDVNSGDNTNNVVIGNNLVATDKDNAVFIGNDSSHIENDFNADATWNHSSDRRQKENIEDDILGLSFINNLRSVTYKNRPPSEFPKEWSAYDANNTKRMGSNKTMHGFIAQDVKEALDREGISTLGVCSFSGWSEDGDGRQRVSFEAFVTPLVKAIQELSAEIDKLKKG